MDNQKMIAIVGSLIVVGILGFTTGLSINVARDGGDSSSTVPTSSSQGDDSFDLNNVTSELRNITTALNSINEEFGSMNITAEIIDYKSEIANITSELDRINSTLASNLKQEPDNITLYGLEEMSANLDNITLAIEDLKQEPEEVSQYGQVSFSGLAQFKFQTGAVIYPEYYGYINISKNGTTLIFNFTDMWKLSNTNGNPWNSTVRGGIDQYWTWVCYQDGVLTEQFNFGPYLGITNNTLGSEDWELADDTLVINWEVSQVPDQIGFYDSHGNFYLRSF